MGIDVVIGRDTADKQRFGARGLIYLGKGYVKMGTYTSLSNTLKVDVARSHVILIAGKRGSGKSYTLGAIAEELACLSPETARNVSSLIFDTMGIFWTMKFKNEKDSPLLKEWNLETKSLPIKVLVPAGKTHVYRSNSIPFDATFALAASELQAEDWITLFNLSLTSPAGVLIQNTLANAPINYTLAELQTIVEQDSKATLETKNIVSSLFKAATNWGVFSETAEGTTIKELIPPGKTTIIDTSVYSSIGAFNIRALVINILTRKIFISRMESRKQEERYALQHGQDYLSYKSATQDPLVWLFIDEAHEFLPKDEKTPATDALIQVLREGRQPGLSLVLATQQPGKIHTDVLSQADIVIAHRVTATADVEALQSMMQSYLLSSLKQAMDDLPPVKGAALVLDDNSERLYPMRVRPRFTWHGGEAPTAIKAELQL
ncbi:ATP-binding protein [Candidatus Pacearchaeota archaeon]|nr:ATP-binding protein [Candidatus Pacearchaeota archaeon]